VTTDYGSNNSEGAIQSRYGLRVLFRGSSMSPLNDWLMALGPRWKTPVMHRGHISVRNPDRIIGEKPIVDTELIGQEQAKPKA